MNKYIDYKLNILCGKATVRQSRQIASYIWNCTIYQTSLLNVGFTFKCSYCSAMSLPLKLGRRPTAELLTSDTSRHQLQPALAIDHKLVENASLSLKTIKRCGSSKQSGPKVGVSGTSHDVMDFFEHHGLLNFLASP